MADSMWRVTLRGIGYCIQIRTADPTVMFYGR